MRTLRSTLAIWVVLSSFWAGGTQAESRPNVVLIMTDDQGYGDLGFTGNPAIRTPHLDSFAEQAAVLDTFYVCPVCAPTRASLMTGRYNYRTRAVDTYIGRAMMDTEEVTLAERLGEAGYRTGIFGKWHLGDNYPLRPMDQGFQESFVHRGGGIGQPADPPGNMYQDPVISHNGENIQTEGYCSDLFTDAAIDFIATEDDRPFFAYLSYNCPHTPLQIPDRYVKPYEEMNLKIEDFPNPGHPVEGKFNAAETSRVYGMVENIDENLGNLFGRLKKLGLEENTIVIFLTDNGPQQPRYKAGLRGRKGSVYEGGIRVPCFVRWTGEIEPKTVKGTALAHIDIVPTLLECCSVPLGDSPPIDGRSFRALLEGEEVDWPERNLYFQWHRGDTPELFRAFAARGPRYKLAQSQGVQERGKKPEFKFELFDLLSDPYERHDISESHPEIVARMKAESVAWFRDVSASRGYAPPRIALGAPEENPVVLTRQDWRGPQAGWGKKSLGYWEVEAKTSGPFDLTLRFDKRENESVATVAFQGVIRSVAIPAGEERATFENVEIGTGPGRLEAWVEAGGERTGVRYVDVLKRGDL